MAPSTRRSLRSRKPSPTNSGEDAKKKAAPQDASNDTEIQKANASQSQNGKTKKTRSVTFSLEKENATPPSPTVSDTSSARRLSARAARSMRRQAKIEKDPVRKGPSSISISNKKSGLKPRRAEMKGKKSSQVSSSKKGKDEEVVKVKLNTGTLYLYKGSHRRAVFVRRL